MTHRPPSRSRAGFTFIEILTVFVVFSVAAMIAVRSVGDTIRRDRVSKAAVILSADLEQAFALAGRQRTPIRLLMDSTTMTFAVADRADTTRKYRQRTMKDGEFALDFMSANFDTLDVMPSGFASDTLRLTLGIYSRGGLPHSQTVRMTRGGLVRIGNR